MIKINLYGGPNCGKSTIAAKVFAELKGRLLNAELVREFAKELVYQGLDMRNIDEGMRLKLLAEQLHREHILRGKVDYLVTDSPMLLTSYYHNKQYATDIAVEHLTDSEYHFYLNRVSLKYEQAGRSHTLEESLEIDTQMRNYLLSTGIELVEVDGSIEERTNKILETLGLL